MLWYLFTAIIERGNKHRSSAYTKISKFKKEFLIAHNGSARAFPVTVTSEKTKCLRKKEYFNIQKRIKRVWTGLIQYFTYSKYLKTSFSSQKSPEFPEISRIPIAAAVPRYFCSAPGVTGTPALLKVITCAPEKSAKLELKMQQKKPSSRGQKGFRATVWISSYKEIPAHLLLNMDLISKPAAAPRAPTATLSWGTKCSYCQ